jgi:hypothetical protein
MRLQSIVPHVFPGLGTNSDRIHFMAAVEGFGNCRRAVWLQLERFQHGSTSTKVADPQGTGN